MKIRGQKEMERKIRAVLARFPDKVEAALKIEAEMIMTRSKRDFVPVDLGTLRSSGFVNSPERKGQTVVVTLGYGGAASAYALSVHERPSEHDPPSWKANPLHFFEEAHTRVHGGVGGSVTFSPTGRGPKYLERPLKEAVAGMRQRVAERIKL